MKNPISSLRKLISFRTVVFTALTLSTSSLYAQTYNGPGGVMSNWGSISGNTENEGELGGSGWFGGELITSAEGITSPGFEGIGSFDIDGGFTMIGALAKLQLDIGKDASVAGTMPVSGIDYDQVKMGTGGSGTITLDGILALRIDAPRIVESTDYYLLIENVSGADVLGAFAGIQINGADIALGADNTFDINGTLFQLSYTGNATAFTLDGGHDVVIKAIDPLAVPEPTSSALLGLVGMSFLVRRKRK